MAHLTFIWNVLQSDQAILSLDSTVDLGMFVFSHDQSQTATAEFEQCTIDGQSDDFLVRARALLVVPSDTYPTLQPYLDTYISDVESRFPLSLSCITGTWSLPQRLRDVLVSQYQTSALSGAILNGTPGARIAFDATLGWSHVFWGSLPRTMHVRVL